LSVNISVDISPGELIDKITILEIKLERIEDDAKLGNIRIEFDTLTRARDEAISPSDELSALSAKLKRVNEALWEIEDDIRDQERAKTFGDEFIKLARGVYVTNDERMEVKREINEFLGSRLVEEKSYAAY
jgi:hypothetical protein